MDNLVFRNPDGLSKPTGYTYVVEARRGRTIYISGQVALDANGELVGRGDFEAQCVQVFENLKACLAAAGTDFNCVVKLGFYFKDISNVGIARAVRDRYLNTAHPPASTAIEVKRLVNEDWLIEVDAIAVVES
jgi:enamine deaminase RidA (YjgF/YER057c/UK114 family)